MFNQFGGGSVNTFFINFADFTGNGHFPVAENFRGDRQGFDNPLCRFIKNDRRFCVAHFFQSVGAGFVLVGNETGKQKAVSRQTG